MSYLAWILIILCASNLLASFALEDPRMLGNKDFLIPSKELNGTSTGGRKLTDLENITVSDKAGRGKGTGTYGGANVVHRRPGEKNAGVVCRPHSLLLSALILGFSFLLLLAFPTALF